MKKSSSTIILAILTVINLIKCGVYAHYGNVCGTTFASTISIITALCMIKTFNIDNEGGK